MATTAICKSIPVNPTRLGKIQPVLHAPKGLVLAQLNFRSPYHLACRDRASTRTKNVHFLRSSFLRFTKRCITHEQRAKELNQKGVDDALEDFDEAVAKDTEKQQKAPWHRQGVDEPPVRKQRSAGAMTKGGRNYVATKE
jgi:hypothetical protein